MNLPSRKHSLATLFALLAALGVALAPAHATAQTLTCTGAISITYTPGVADSTQNVTISSNTTTARASLS